MNASVSSSQFSISRYTIRNPEEADKPRSRRELNATRALGAILNKPQWWVKWTTRPDVRTKWLREIDEQLIRLNVSQTIRGWPSKRYGQFETVYTLAEAANSRFEDISHLAEQVLENVPYPRPVDESGAYSVGLAYETDDEMDEFGRDVKGEHVEDDEDNSAEVFHEFDDDEDESAYGYDSDYDDDRFYSGFSVRHSSSEFDEHHTERLNSFCEIGWYVTMAIAREKLRDLPLAEWTDANLTAMIGVHENEDEQIIRTTELMLAVVLDPRPISLDILRGHLPDESRDEVLKLLLLHFQRVIAILDATKNDIATVLDLIIQHAHLADSSLAQHNTPGTVPQTWLSDDAIPVELKRKFVAEVASLENGPDEQKDWHPHSDNQVLDLVHPSLFCGRINKNMIRRPSSWMTPAVSVASSHETSTVSEVPLTGTAAEYMNSILFAPTTGLLQGHWSTQFQWLPSEFEVAEDGRSVNIRTYINNLHPEIHASMYDSIGSIFSRFVPLFDQVISSLDDARIQKKLDDSSVRGRIYRGKSTPVHPANATVIENLTRELGAPPTSSLRRLAPPGLFEIDSPRFSLKGNRCQVIVKIAEIQLTPDKPNYNGGSWHIEGTDAERIIATGLYYFGCENITESRLSFRMFVAMPDYDQNDDVGVALSYELYEDHSMVQSLGSVTAMEDRCVVFPNTYQHKVEPFSLADPSKPGVRKILAFFLVDPVNDPIPSTAIVPPQQQEWIDLAREPQLMSMGLPDVVTDRIREMTRTGMSLEEAKSLRLGLMAERKVANVDQDEYYTLSLCEH